MTSAANSNLKNVTLELGGKSPTLIFDDANLDEAVPACALSIGFNSGQVCIASSRLYVQEGIYDKFLKAFAEAFNTYKQGDPLDKSTTMGPQADEIQRDIVAKYIELGNKEGKALIGGKKAEGKGFFFEPTIFTDVAHDARVNKEEVFGPVVVVHKFKTEEEGLALANDSECASLSLALQTC
jgi:aldehyde dehydrogenase (NAD+)